MNQTLFCAGLFWGVAAVKVRSLILKFVFGLACVIAASAISGCADTHELATCSGPFVAMSGPAGSASTPLAAVK